VNFGHESIADELVTFQLGNDSLHMHPCLQLESAKHDFHER
jgi:hypothetical protein